MRGAHNLFRRRNMYSLVHFIIEGFAICCFFNEIKRNRSGCAFSKFLFSVIISVVCCLLSVSSIVIIMAAKRVLSKSVDSFDEIFNIFYSKSEGLYNEIDNWSARINSLLELDIRKEDCSFSDVLKFLEFFNFLSGEYDLLYHGQIKVVEEIMAKRDGYSHDFLRGHLTFVGNKIRHVSNENPLKNTMRNTIGLAELNFVSKGTILVDGLKLLKSIILELEKKLPKKFSIEMQETGSYTPYVYCIKEEKAKQYLDRYKSIDFEQRLKDHPWSPAPRKKQQKEAAESSIIPKKQQYPLKQQQYPQKQQQQWCSPSATGFGVESLTMMIHYRQHHAKTHQVSHKQSNLNYH